MVDTIIRYSREDMLRYRDLYTDPPYAGWDLKKIIQSGLEKQKRKKSENNVNGGAGSAGNLYGGNNNSAGGGSSSSMLYPSGSNMGGGLNAEAWRPQKATSDVQMVAKLVRGVLNRITPEKYDTLIEKLFDPIIFSNSTLLDITIKAIFEKALQEPNFSVMYARACFDMARYEISTLTDQRERRSKLRSALLNAVQHEFAKTLLCSRETPPVAIDTQEQQKARAVANIQFVGELITYSMISEAITMAHIVQPLLEGDQPTDMCVELLCTLLHTIGSRMGHCLDSVFLRIQELIGKKPYCPRIKFMMIDLVETRNNGWQRRVQRNDRTTPMKLDSIQKDISKRQSQSPGTPLLNKSGGNSGSRPPRKSSDPTATSSIALPLPEVETLFMRKVVTLAEDSTDPMAAQGTRDALHNLCSTAASGLDVAMACAVYEVLWSACLSSKENKRDFAFHFFSMQNVWQDAHLEAGFAQVFAHAIKSDVKSDVPLFFDRWTAGACKVFSPPRAIAMIRYGTEFVLRSLDDVDEGCTPISAEDAREVCVEVVEAYLRRLPPPKNVSSPRSAAAVVAGTSPPATSIPPIVRKALRSELALCTQLLGKAVDYQ